MKKFIKTLGISVFLLFTSNFTFASDSGKTNDNSLFKIGRSKDANEIYYEVKTTPGGLLDIKEPIKIYWIKYTDNNAIEPLTLVQQKFAYGLKFLKVNSESAEFQFVSYSKRTLSLRKNSDGNYGVFTEVDGKKVELERVFIQIDGGTFWFPKITRVEVHAKKAEAGELLVEVIEL
jgi:hypothetical protein